MSFEIILTERAKSDIERIRDSGSKKSLMKVYTLLEELKLHPTTGTGKPERLKHFTIPTWSRRISQKHRLVYEIQEERIIVMVLSKHKPLSLIQIIIYDPGEVFRMGLQIFLTSFISDKCQCSFYLL